MSKINPVIIIQSNIFERNHGVLGGAISIIGCQGNISSSIFVDNFANKGGEYIMKDQVFFLKKSIK